MLSYLSAFANAKDVQHAPVTSSVQQIITAPFALALCHVNHHCRSWSCEKGFLLKYPENVLQKKSRNCEHQHSILIRWEIILQKTLGCFLWKCVCEWAATALLWSQSRETGTISSSGPSSSACAETRRIVHTQVRAHSQSSKKQGQTMLGASISKLIRGEISGKNWRPLKKCSFRSVISVSRSD